MTIPQQLEDALARHHAGDIGAAARLYRAILNEQPDHPDALHMLGIIAQQMKNPVLALELMDAALAKKPDMAMAWCNRALVLRVLGRPGDAWASAQKALQADPKLADAWDMAGSLLREQGKLDEACAHSARAAELAPANIRFLANYAVLLLATGALQAAFKIAREQEKRDPQFVPLTQGNILQAAGYPERAIPYFQKTAAMVPHFAEAHINEALARLQIGDFERGLALWEKRLPMPNAPQLPRWSGGKVRHLLLYEDQGIGDALQCLRYISAIRERADKITLRLTGSLRRLLAAHYPDLDVVTLDDPAPGADACLPLMSLPYLLGTRLDTIPAPIPYLRAGEAWRAPWRERLASVPEPRIGLVWGGNPDNRNDHKRSLHFSQLDALIKSGGAHLVSLQKGPQKKQADLAAAGIFDADPLLQDFADTAGLIAGLDLVIAVDTAVVHLAGAMGKPAWLMIPFSPDWRWLLAREDSPWYPALRIFRQTKPGEWKWVIAAVAADLEKLIGGDRSVLAPRPWRGEPARQNPDALVLDD